MNLVDIINPKYGLQQDEWSLSKPKFGKEDQLEIIGWGAKNDYVKVYIARCHICMHDAELFGEGMFRTWKSSVKAEKLPCGCSSQPKWSEDQFKTLCSRKAKELGYEFIDWASGFYGQQTKIRMLCQEHGEWITGSIMHLLGQGRGCPICKGGVVKPDNVMIDSFMSTGQFTEGTKFWRSDRLNSVSQRAYWFVLCPDCNYTGEATSSCLQKGCRPCLCTRSRQKEAYINWIIDDNNQAIAIKFGIANITEKRVYDQNRRCMYEIRNYLIYNFPDKESCRAAERECKQVLECSLLTKEELSDGFSETTSVCNLVRIKQIYEKHGGVKLLNKEI